MDEARAALQQFRTDRDATQQTVEESIRDSLHALQSSYPSIALSKDAADAARVTLRVVTRNYVRGTQTVLELLDAQNTSIAADLTAVNAGYAALTDYMNLQRRLGQYDFFLTASQQDDRLQRLKAYIAGSTNS
jgi:outer membrane protein TolC